jgi:hypothetical protein
MIWCHLVPILPGGLQGALAGNATLESLLAAAVGTDDRHRRRAEAPIPLDSACGE